MKKQYVPETGFVVEGDFVYNLKHSKDNGSYRYKQGMPVMCNDVTIRFAKSHDSNMTEGELHKFAAAMCEAANSYLQKEYNTSFSNESTGMVGKTVVVTYGHHFGKEGTIEEVYPAGMLDEEELFKVRFSKNSAGQFIRKQFGFVKQIVTA